MSGSRSLPPSRPAHLALALLALISCGAAAGRTPAPRDPGPDPDPGGTGGDSRPAGTGGAPARSPDASSEAPPDAAIVAPPDAAPLSPDVSDPVSPDAPADLARDARPADGAPPPPTDGPPLPPTDPFPPGAAPIGAGWTEIFPRHNVDHPPGQTRYTEENGKFHLWLFNTDASTFPGRDAGPRSEIHWYNDYSTGQAQFQGDFYIDHDCAHASVMQIFGATGRSTAFMAWAMPDSLRYYGSQLIHQPAWDRFLRLNVTHDTATGAIDVYVDGQKKATFMDHGPANHYFKCGIYHQPNMTPRCDVYIQNIHIFAK